MTTPTTPASEAPKDLEGFLDFYLVKKAPFQIPDSGREMIVQFGPWITLVLLILTLPLLLFALGIGAILIPFGGIGYATGFGVLTIFVIAEVGLLIAALPGLFDRKMAGWRLLFYSQLVSVVYNVLSGNIIGGLLFGIDRALHPVSGAAVVSRRMKAIVVKPGVKDSIHMRDMPDPRLKPDQVAVKMIRAGCAAPTRRSAKG